MQCILSMARCLIPFFAILVLSGGGFQPVAANVESAEPAPGLPSRPPAVPSMLLLPSPEALAPAAARSRQRIAHAIVVRTSPDQSGVAPDTIGKVEVWYDAGIRDDFAALAVIDANGDRVDKRDAAIDRSDQSHVSASVGLLAPGTYTVRYRALSADGHIVSGAWNFEVRSK
jgi:methionine-rich copper-binding protein CopC